jgi:large subunit ribosomal protein L9
MEIILKQDVEKVGFKDEIIEVKNGYGRNFLIPNGVAILATASAKKVLAENLKQRAFKEKKIIEIAKKQAETLSALEAKIFVKSSADGKLFGSITNVEIADTLSKKGIEVSKKNISVEGKAIKRTGKYNVTIRLHREVSVDMNIEVVTESK